MESVMRLVRWCSTTAQISNYFESEDGNVQAALDTYERVAEEVQNCAASYYICRFIITDMKGKIIQTGNSMAESLPLTKGALQKLHIAENGRAEAFERIILDPLSIEERAFIVPVSQPILHVHTRLPIGWVYIGVSAGLFTAALKNHPTGSGDGFYLTLGDATYKLDGTCGKMANGAFAPAARPPVKTFSERTRTGFARISNAQSVFVQYPFSLFNACYTQTLSARQDKAQTKFFVQMTCFASFALALFAAMLLHFLNRSISVPVAAIQKRLLAISGGDFSADLSIEWANELGDIGRGINALAKSIDNLMKERLDNERQKRKLEYQMLQSQINPHFLYNTLNSIRWMATIQNAPGIAEMVTSLAGLLRNVSNNTSEELSLRDELSLLDDYFVIQRYRYGGSITMNTDVEDKALLDAFLPRFTLQPLIENAIFHGIEPKGTAGKIDISVSKCKNGDVQIGITDNGVGMNSAAIKQALSGKGESRGGLFRHVGLFNVDRRLKYAFGASYGLSIESKEGEYTRVFFAVPYSRTGAV